MPTTDTSGLINFSKTVSLSGVCSITLDMDKGVMGKLVVVLYDKNNQVLLTGGDGTPPLTTQSGGHVSYPFTVPQSINALSWGVTPMLPVANAGPYDAVVQVLDAQGNVLATSCFSGALAGTNDPMVQDGCFVTNP